MTDEDGVTARDFVTFFTMALFVVGSIMGLVRSYQGVEMTDQYEFIMGQITDVTITVIISVMGLQASANIIGTIGNRRSGSKNSTVNTQQQQPIEYEQPVQQEKPTYTQPPKYNNYDDDII